MDNNKGFTLIELLVSIAIFGIVIAAVFGFMISGSKTYSNINGKVDLQTNAQLTMNFLEEYLIDCDEAIYDKEDTTNKINSLYIINKATTNYSVYIFKFYGNNHSIYFIQGTAKKQADGSFICDHLESPALLSDMISAFKPTLSDTGDHQNVVSVKLTITFKNYSTEIISSKLIALRNKPAYKIVVE